MMAWYVHKSCRFNLKPIFYVRYEIEDLRFDQKPEEAIGPAWHIQE